MSGEPQLTEQPSGFAIRGELTFESVPVLWAGIQGFFSNKQHIEVDLKDVTYSNSAGLVLLTACIRHAHHLKMSIVFKNLPAQLKQIANVTGIKAILDAA